MADLPGSQHSAPPGDSRSLRQRATAALPGLVYVGLVLLLFGGLAIDQLPESQIARFGMVGAGAVVVLLLAAWLGRGENGEAHGSGD
jgi:hypothetical protein